MFDHDLNIVHVFAGVGVVVLFVLILAFVLTRLRGEREKFPYAAKPILSPAEAKFHASLRRCLPPGTALLAKTRLADFLEVTLRGDEFMRYFGKISQKHSDFLLVQEATSEPLLAIELDDSTHRTSKRTIESDRFKNRAYEAAGLPILRVPAANTYDERELRQALRQALPVVNERRRG